MTEQVLFGWDGVAYADDVHRRVLDKRIEALEKELERLKKMRRLRNVQTKEPTKRS